MRFAVGQRRRGGRMLRLRGKGWVAAAQEGGAGGGADCGGHQEPRPPRRRDAAAVLHLRVPPLPAASVPEVLGPVTASPAAFPTPPPRRLAGWRGGVRLAADCVVQDTLQGGSSSVRQGLRSLRAARGLAPYAAATAAVRCACHCSQQNKGIWRSSCRSAPYVP